MTRDDEDIFTTRTIRIRPRRALQSWSRALRLLADTLVKDDAVCGPYGERAAIVGIVSISCNEKEGLTVEVHHIVKGPGCNTETLAVFETALCNAAIATPETP